MPIEEEEEVVSVAQCYTVTHMDSHTDTLMTPRRATITNKRSWSFKIFVKEVIRRHANVE